MKVYLTLREHGDACRATRDRGGTTQYRTKDDGICPAIGYKDTSPTHCVHTFPDLSKVCCGCELVLVSSIAMHELEDEGLI